MRSIVRNSSRPTDLPESETRKSASGSDFVDVAGQRPYRAGQLRATLHAGMDNVLKIVRFDAVGWLRRSLIPCRSLEWKIVPTNIQGRRFGSIP